MFICMYWISRRFNLWSLDKAGKTSKQVTKDPKKHKRLKKSQKLHIKKLKEEILRDNQIFTSSPTGKSTLSSSSSTGNSTPSAFQDLIHIYGVSVVAVLAIGACVFFLYNQTSSQTLNNK